MINEAFQLGVALECVSNDIPVQEFTKLAGAASRMDEPDSVPLKRMVVKAAHDVMTFCGDEACAPAQHLKLISEAPGWSKHADDVYSSVVKCCQVNGILEKRAFTDAVEGVGNLAKGVGYAGLLGGAGLGSLYWMLSRHATQDDADIEAKKHQAEYYHNLNKELKDSLRRKYRYAGGERP